MKRSLSICAVCFISAQALQLPNPLGRPAIACVVPDKGFTDRRDTSGRGNELFNGTYDTPDVRHNTPFVSPPPLSLPMRIMFFNQTFFLSPRRVRTRPTKRTVHMIINPLPPPPPPPPSPNPHFDLLPCHNVLCIGPTHNRFSWPTMNAWAVILSTLRTTYSTRNLDGSMQSINTRLTRVCSTLPALDGATSQWG